MKNAFIYSLILLALLSSCAQTKTPKTDLNEESTTLYSGDFPVTYVLYKTTGRILGSERTGEAMQWQESYVFMGDNTFIKTRITNAETQTATGTYKLVNQNNESYYELVHEKRTDMVGNCSGNSMETLILEPLQTLKSNWMACDGPGLYYKLKTE